MKPTTDWQPDITTAIRIVQDYRNTADYWVRYYHSKTWDTDEHEWKLVRLILDRILKDLTKGDSNGN
jgi:hypothetical protein